MQIIPHTILIMSAKSSAFYGTPLLKWGNWYFQPGILLLQGKMHKRDTNYLVIWLNFSSLD